MPWRKLSANLLRTHSERRQTKVSARNTLGHSAMTTTPNPQPIPGVALLGALGVAVVAVSGVSVFYWRHDHVRPTESTSVSQAASAPPAGASPAMDKDGRFLWRLATEGLERDRETLRSTMRVAFARAWSAARVNGRSFATLFGERRACRRVPQPISPRPLSTCIARRADFDTPQNVERALMAVILCSPGWHVKSPALQAD
jgi:hypothetical protein